MNGRLFEAHADCVISSALIYADMPEYDELHFVRRHLNADDALIDVGANVGHIGLLLNDIVRAERIFAFEPTPVTFQRLQANWELNRTFGSPRLFQMAVGNDDGEALIPDVSVPNTMNAIVSTEDEFPRNFVGVAVPVTRLDSMRRWWHGQRIGLLKIDVEGHEDDVFRGATNVLKQDRPKLVMFESLDGGLSPVVNAVLTSSGYRVFQLVNGQVDFSRRDAQNLFACPVEDSANYCSRPNLCAVS
ncbi:MAG: FkbM family methyltransferase [Planctomycetaceae bacterium]|nr:FkbM family methyltransferase [Planctomycetaceae bacterium]